MKAAPSPWRAVIESMFYVIDKSGATIPFMLNWAQAKLDSHLTGRDLIPKARQLGMSTYFLARFTAKAMTTENRRCVIVSHEEEATKRLLQRAQFFIDNLRLRGHKVEAEFSIAPEPTDEEMELEKLKLITTRKSKAEIVFTETGSWFFIGTAGSGAFGRGDTITDLHCSEFAHWPNPKEIALGLFGSVPSIENGGEIFIESTGNGIANNFANRVQASISGKSYWTTHFFPFQDEPTYRVKLTRREKENVMKNLREDLDEPRLVKDFKLSSEQIRWRRDRLADMDNNLPGFRQEFPMTIDECFQATGNTFFDRMVYRPTLEWKEKNGTQTGHGELASHPMAGYHYLVGCDSSGGLGLDNAVLEVGCIETNEQVAEWWSSATPPDRLAHKAKELADRYNNATLVVESNNHGLVVLNELRHLKFPLARLHKHRGTDSKKKEGGLMDLGYQTTTRTKPLSVGRLRTYLAEGFIIHGPATYIELQSFVETPEGKLQAQEGAHDDRVMALVMMAVGMKKARLRAEPVKPKIDQRPHPFSIEGIHNRIDSQRQTDGVDTPSFVEEEYEEFFI